MGKPKEGETIIVTGAAGSVGSLVGQLAKADGLHVIGVVGNDEKANWIVNELDITYLQYMVLMLLWQESSLNVKELGQRLRLDSGTLTPLLKRLESKGLVERKRSELDERVRIITITRLGRGLKRKARNIPHKLACSIANVVGTLRA